MKKEVYHNKKTGNKQVKNQGTDCPFALSKHIHFETIDSTNTWAKTHVEQWAAEGVTLVTASQQTAGRGRFKRRWESPPDVNIYATFCFWFPLQRPDIGQIPQLLALAAAQTLEKNGFTPKIKWPNDVLLNDKKIGGILCETVLENSQRGVICGIGLNINMSQEILEEIDRPATSLLVESGSLFKPFAILEDLKNEFIPMLHQFIAKSFAPFFPLFQARSALQKGQKIYFHDNQHLIEAQFECLHPSGAVELRLCNGNLKIFYAGEFVNN